MCDLLTSTKVAGQPQSLFMNEFYADWASYWKLSIEHWPNDHEFDRAYLESALLYGTGESEVFGLRIQYRSLDGLIKRLRHFYPRARTDKSLFSEAFETAHYIHLSRRDKVAQAVSLLRAEQTGLWHVNPDGTERERLKDGQAPQYDYESILKFLTELEEHDQSWVSWFEQQEIQPLSITYESLSADPQKVLSDILLTLGLDLSKAAKIKVKTAKLSNSESCEWANRFRAEYTG